MKGQHGDKSLRRIIWMLLSLSLLAERASSACWPVRCLVLWILRRAEAVACGFVAEIAEMPLGFIDLSDFPDDNSPGGALCLAMRFTALAAALQYLLDQPQPFEGNIRQAHAAAGMRPVLRHLGERSSIGLPGSRAPPSCLRQNRQSRLQSRNGFLERFGVPGYRPRRSPSHMPPKTATGLPSVSINASFCVPAWISQLCARPGASKNFPF